MSNDLEITSAVPKPDHVPDALVYDLDLFNDPKLKARGHDRVLELIRTTQPIFWTPRNGGHWVLRGHEAVFKASRDPTSFTSEFVPYAEVMRKAASLPPGAPRILQAVPISVDPPTHTKFRAPLNSAFSPKRIMAMKDDMRSLAVELIESVRDKGRCEFMAEIAEPYPVTLFLRILGLPVDRQREYRDLAREHLAATVSTTPQDMQARMRKIVDIMQDTLAERRIEPRDDLISALWKQEIDGAPITQHDMENYTIVLFIGGLDTVMNGLGHGVRHLALHPKLQESLRTNPRLIPDAAEEILRRYTFTVPPRMVARDLVFEGVEMKQGERAFLFLPGADLDPSEFTMPESFDLGREDKAHIAFGAGPHRCVGSHLARLELQVFYEQFLARIPSFRLDPHQPVRFHGGHIIGPDSLHLVWNEI